MVRPGEDSDIQSHIKSGGSVDASDVRERFYCDTCVNDAPYNRRHDLVLLPPVLVLHLCRFDGQGKSRPLLPVTRFLILGQRDRGPHQYRLIGGIVHGGETASSGHYYWLRNEDRLFTRVSDDHVSELDWRSALDVLSTDGYLVAYEETPATEVQMAIQWVTDSRHCFAGRIAFPMCHTIPENEDAMTHKDKEMFGFEDGKTMVDVQDSLRALGVELDAAVFPSSDSQSEAAWQKAFVRSLLYDD